MRRSMFDLSHEHKLSMDMGTLIPVCCEEVLPGDTFMGSTSLLARVAPLVNPVMHKVELRVHHWWVPNRLIWDAWPDWITGKDDVSTMPTLTLASDLDLADHMGMHPTAGLDMSALPVRAYNKIWNEYYRDQDLQTERDEDDLTLARITWEKDYFTIARPQPQQGDPQSIEFNFADAPVYGIGSNNQSFATGPQTFYEAGGAGAQSAAKYKNTGTGSSVIIEEDPNNAGYPNIYADLSNLGASITIDELRRQIALQKIAEARARFGERYIDYLRFLGLNPNSGMLERPEFLGGGKQNINFSEVLATAEGASTEVGDMFGHGIAGLRTRRYRKMFEEHGWLLSLISARPKTVYMDAVPRKYTRVENMDYWQKELEQLPWQEVKQSEVHYDGSSATTFGYVPRYEEYRHGYSYVSGSFRDGPEIDWHMGRTSGTAPTLNSSFVTCTPTDRIYGDVAMPELLINAYNSIKAMRLVRKNASIQGL